MHDWKVGGVENIFAPVTSDLLECDLETMAVKNWEGWECVWMMGMKMITSTSMLVEGNKSLLDHQKKKKCNHPYQYCGQLIFITSAWNEYRKTLGCGSLAYIKRMDDKNEIHLAETDQGAISNTNNVCLYWKFHNSRFAVTVNAASSVHVNVGGK